jgi:hypothetical protein
MAEFVPQTPVANETAQYFDGVKMPAAAKP